MFAAYQSPQFYGQVAIQIAICAVPFYYALRQTTLSALLRVDWQIVIFWSSVFCMSSVLIGMVGLALEQIIYASIYCMRLCIAATIFTVQIFIATPHAIKTAVHTSSSLIAQSIRFVCDIVAVCYGAAPTGTFYASMAILAVVSLAPKVCSMYKTIRENSRYNQGSEYNPCVEVEFSVPGCIAIADQAQLAREIKQREDAEWERYCESVALVLKQEEEQEARRQQEEDLRMIRAIEQRRATEDKREKEWRAEQRRRLEELEFQRAASRLAYTQRRQRDLMVLVMAELLTSGRTLRRTAIDRRERETKRRNLSEQKVWGKKRIDRWSVKKVQYPEQEEEELRRKTPLKAEQEWRRVEVKGEERFIRGLKKAKRASREEKGKGKAC